MGAVNIDRIIRRYEPKREYILDMLHDIQDASPTKSLSPEAMEKVAEYLGIPVSEVYGTATFYSMFSPRPRGKHIIRVCVSPPCHAAGKEEILATLKEELGIEVGETTDDGLFTLETSSCLGVCGVAPVIMIDDTVYGNLTPERVKEIIASYRK